MAKGPAVPPPALHPFVQRYLATSVPINEVVLQVPEPRDPVLQAIMLMVNAYYKPDSYAAAEQAALRLDLSACDPCLHVILLRQWAMVANLHEHRRYDEVQALTRRARALVSDRMPPEIRSLVLDMESLLINVGGDISRRQDILRQALDLVPRTSPRRPGMLLNFAWSYSVQGRLLEFEAELEGLRGDQECGPLVPIIELGDRVETGQVGEAATLIAGLGRPSEPFWQSGRAAHALCGTYRILRALTAILQGDSSLGRAYDELGQGDPRDPEFRGPEMKPEQMPLWLLTLHHLCERRPAQALQFAREQAVHWGEGLFREAGIVSLNLVRSELACGNAEAARRLLEKRRGMGNIHYLDGLFQARIELLAGDRAAAARQFAAALAAADRYDAHGRIDFELRLACELSPGEIARMSRVAPEPTARRSRKPHDTATPGRPDHGLRLIGDSPEIVRVRETVERLAALDVPVLIVGETGTGKELVARQLHERGPRCERPFVAINCGAIAETLLESELFGHEKGAFTGAERAHRGLFEEAGDGSVFLDEIGEISPRLQVMLLRVLETGEVRPVGSGRARRIRCRVLAATNADLQELVDRNVFRRDLYYRLKRMEVRLAPLRERPGDVLSLAGHFLCEGRRDGVRPALSERLRRWLQARAWPGNVRELRNFIERLRLLNSEKREYDLDDVPAEAGERPGSGPDARGPAPAPRRETPVGGPDVAGSAAPAAAGVQPDEPDEAALLAKGRSPLRRRDRLRALFARHGKLTRQELTALLGVSPDTASRDLKLLMSEGLIERVAPTPSPRTHYFRLRAGKGENAPQ